MQHLSRVRPGAGGRKRITPAVVVLVFALAASLLVAALAVAGPRRIVDADAVPSYTAVTNGSGASLDSAMSVAADAGGAWIVGWAGNGADIDATLMRVTATGVAKDLKRYDGAAHKNDLFLKVVEGPNGTVYAAGATTAANNKTDILIEKFSKTGSKVWAKTYDGSLHGNDTATALGVDKAGNVTVCGYSDGGNGTDVVVVKWTSKGARALVWRYDGAGKLDDLAVDTTVEGNGTTYVTGNVKAAGAKDAILTVKFSPTGAKAWQKVYLGTTSLGANVRSISARPGGGVYVAGWTQSAVGNKDGLVLRYSTSGSPQVLPPWAAAGDQSFNDVAVTTTRIVAAVGVDSAPGNAQCHARWWGSETAASQGFTSGNLWDDAFTAVAPDAFGAFCFTGWQNTSAADSQVLTYRLRILPGGAPNTGFRSLWNMAANLSRGYGVAANGTTVYVAGSAYKDAADGYDQFVLTYVY
jgi:hypothetical protein